MKNFIFYTHVLRQLYRGEIKADERGIAGGWKKKALSRWRRALVSYLMCAIHVVEDLIYRKNFDFNQLGIIIGTLSFSMFLSCIYPSLLIFVLCMYLGIYLFFFPLVLLLSLERLSPRLTCQSYWRKIHSYSFTRRLQGYILSCFSHLVLGYHATRSLYVLSWNFRPRARSRDSCDRWKKKKHKKKRKRKIMKWNKIKEYIKTCRYHNKIKKIRWEQWNIFLVVW